MGKKKKSNRRKQSSSEVQGPPSAKVHSQGTKVQPEKSQQEIREIKQLNSPFLLGLAASLIILGLGTYFLHGYQVSRNATVLKENAERAIEEGDRERGMRLLGHYIQLAPNDMDALARLGGLIDESPPSRATWESASRIYSQLLRDAPHRSDTPQIRYRLTQLLMRLNEFQQAEGQIKKLYRTVDKDIGDNSENRLPFDRAELFALHGRCHLRLDEPERALAFFLASLSTKAERVEYYESAIYVLEQLGEQVPQRDNIKELLGESPLKRVKVSTDVLGFFPIELSEENQEQNQDEERSESVSQAENLAGTSSQVRTAEDILQSATQPLIDYLLAQMTDRAQPKYKSHLARARYYQSKDNFEQVELEITEAQRLAPNEPAVRIFASTQALVHADRLAEEGRFEEARQSNLESMKLAETGKRVEPLNLQYDLLLAGVQLQQHRLEEDSESGTEHIIKVGELYQAAINRLPDSREGYLKLDDQEERDSQLLFLNVLEVQLRAELVDVQLMILEFPGLDSGQTTEMREEVSNLISELEMLTSDDGLIFYLKSRQHFVEIVPGSSIQRQLRLSPQSESAANWSDVVSELKKTRLVVSDRRSYRRKIDQMLLRCYKEMENPDETLSLLLDAFRRDTEWRRGRLELARALDAVGRTEEAFQHYQVLWRQYRIRDVPLAMIEIQIRQQLGKPKEDRDWSNARSFLDQILKVQNENVDYLLLDVELRLLEQDYTAGDKVLQALISREEASPDEKIRIRQSDIRFQLFRGDKSLEERLSNAKNSLAKAVDALGTNAKLAISELQIAQYESQADFESTSEVILNSIETFSAKSQTEILEALVIGFAYLKNDNAKINVLEVLVNLHPNRLAYRVQIAELAGQNDNEKLFSETLTSIRRIEGATGPHGNYLDAARIHRQIALDSTQVEPKLPMIEQQELHSKAMALLDQIEKDRPNWAKAFVLRGALEGANGDEGAQLNFYRKAIDLGTVNTDVYEYVLNYLQNEGHHDEINAVVAKLRSLNTRLVTPTISSYLAQSHFDQEQDSLALSVLRDSIINAPEEDQALMKGMLDFLEYQKRSRTEPHSQELTQLIDSAKKNFETAVSRNPQRENDWVRYVAFYVRLGDLESAKSIISRVDQEMPDNPPVLKPLTLARCYEMIHELDKARTQFENAVSANPESLRVRVRLAYFYSRIGDHSQERVHLKKIESLAATSSPILAAISRNRQMEIDSLERNTYASALDAIKDLEQVKPQRDSQELLNLLTQVKILSRFPVYDFRIKLIDALDKIATLRTLQLSEHLSLINLCFQTRQYTNALRRAEELEETFKNDLVVLAALAEIYLEQQEFQKLEEVLKQLKSAAPVQTITITSLAARLWNAKGQSSQAVEHIRKYMETIGNEKTAEEIFWDEVSRTNYNLAFQWLISSPAISDSQLRYQVEKGRFQIRQKKLQSALNTLFPVLTRPEIQRQVRSMRYAQCGRIFTQIGQPAEAETAYRNFVKLDDRSESIILVIRAMAQQNKVEQTLKLCEQSVDAVGAADITTIALATLRRNEHTPSQSGRVFSALQQALSLKPTHPILLRNLADYHDMKQEYAEAESIYLRMLDGNSDNLLALNNLAWLFSMRKSTPARTQQARKLIDHAIELAGPSAGLLDTRATVLLADGRTTEAIGELNRAIQAAPSSLRYLLLCRALLMQKNVVAARKSYEKAITEGLKASNLHPLERPYLKLMQQELAIPTSTVQYTPNLNNTKNQNN